MNQMRRIGIPLLALAIAAFCAFKWQALSTLQRENQELRARMQAAESQAKADAHVAEKLAQQEAEAKDLRAQVKDLPRLRNEVRQLRAATNELAKLRAEQERLKAAPPAAPGTAKAGIATDRSLMAKETWAFAGYASPDAAFQSAIWAMNKGDIKTLMDSLSLEAREDLQKEWENKSDEEIARMNASELKKIEGYRIGERKIIDENTVVLDVFLEGERIEKKQLFKKQGNEWKLAGPAED